MNHGGTIFSVCENWELNHFPSLRYASYAFGIQTTGITYLSKSISKIKKKKHLQREESYQYLKRGTVSDRTQDRAL